MSTPTALCFKSTMREFVFLAVRTTGVKAPNATTLGVMCSGVATKQMTIQGRVLKLSRGANFTVSGGTTTFKLFCTRHFFRGHGVLPPYKLPWIRPPNKFAACVPVRTVSLVQQNSC